MINDASWEPAPFLRDDPSRCAAPRHEGDEFGDSVPSQLSQLVESVSRCVDSARARFGVVVKREEVGHDDNLRCELRPDRNAKPKHRDQLFVNALRKELFEEVNVEM